MIDSPNYTQIPNIYFDEIMQTLNGSENLVFLTIMRKTFGWHKEKDRIAYSQIMEVSGISSRSTISSALKILLEKGYIESETKGQQITYSVSINETVQKSNQSKTCTLTSPKTVPLYSETSPKTVHTKESNINKLSKEIYTEIETAYVNAFKAVIPNGEPILDYGAIRKRQKAVLSKLTKEKILLAIERAKKDKWIIENGFSLLLILGDFQLNKLINGQPQSVYSKPLPVQTRTAFLDMED